MTENSFSKDVLATTFTDDHCKFSVVAYKFCVLTTNSQTDVDLGHEPQVAYAWPRVCNFDHNESLHFAIIKVL